MRLVPLAIMMGLAAAPCTAADAFSPLVAAPTLDGVRAAGRTSASLGANGQLSLIPAVSSREEIIAAVAAARPSVGTEILTIITGLKTPADSPAGWRAIYDSLHAVSTMRGITYWSGSRGRRETLFVQSYALDPATRRTRIPDPLFSSIPPVDDLYTFQEDGSFGRNTYREHFDFRGDHLAVRIENVSAISFLLIPLISPGNLVSRVVLVPRGNEILFYGASYMRMGVSVGDHRSLEASLKYRLLALEEWLHARLAAQLGS